MDFAIKMLLMPRLMLLVCWEAARHPIYYISHAEAIKFLIQVLIVSAEQSYCPEGIASNATISLSFLLTILSNLTGFQ